MNNPKITVALIGALGLILAAAISGWSLLSSARAQTAPAPIVMPTLSSVPSVVPTPSPTLSRAGICQAFVKALSAHGAAAVEATEYVRLDGAGVPVQLQPQWAPARDRYRAAATTTRSAMAEYTAAGFYLPSDPNHQLNVIVDELGEVVDRLDRVTPSSPGASDDIEALPDLGKKLVVAANDLIAPGCAA